MKNLIIILCLIFAFGCAADYGKVKVDNRGFEVEAGQDRDGHHDGDRHYDSHDRDRHHDSKKNKHCPPGHKKKGWCK